MSVYGYCRVSTLRQASDGDSLEHQRRQIEGYAKMRDFTLDEVFVEEGVSGSVPAVERPISGPLLDMLRRGDILVAAKLDRLFRSALDALTTVDDFRRRGVHLHLLDLGGDVADSGIAKLFLTIAAAFAEAERDRIRERIGQSKADQRRMGRHLGGGVPVGYRKVPDPRGRGFVLEPIEAEIEAVRYAKARLAAGASYRQIAAELRGRGYETSDRAGVKRLVFAKMVGLDEAGPA